MADIKIAVINATSDDSVLTDAEVQAVVPALQQQVTADFAPVWGTNADLAFVPRGGQPPAGAWWLSLLDNSDQANALGYHDLTSEGLPLGKVFVLSDKQGGFQWTVTASHELLEMLGDPDINLWAFPHPDARADRLYAYEDCDPCEADGLGYRIDGTLVSDFVYPAWFESFRRPGSTQFDKQGHITQPFQILAGGYALVYDIRSGTGYHQVFGDELTFTPNLRPRVGSRRERRMTHRDHWMRSTAHLPCGQERWPVKTLADPDAGRVGLAAPEAATVMDLRALARPVAADAAGPQASRLAPVELTAYTVTATLVGAKIEQDSDVHLVIADPRDRSATMIVEFPDPHCVQAHDPNLVARLAAARAAILAAGGPALQRLAAGGLMPAEAFDPQTGRPRLQPLAGTAQITGVGFFDRLHGQDGVAPNGIELHPVLAFTLQAPRP
jgi:hypothetical protein